MIISAQAQGFCLIIIKHFQSIKPTLHWRSGTAKGQFRGRGEPFTPQKAIYHCRKAISTAQNHLHYWKNPYKPIVCCCCFFVFWGGGRLRAWAVCCCSACNSTKTKKITEAKGGIIHWCSESEHLHCINRQSFKRPQFRGLSVDSGFLMCLWAVSSNFWQNSRMRDKNNGLLAFSVNAPLV